jgi:hypothetical protein
MIEKPSSFLPPPSQPWGRWVDYYISELDKRVEKTSLDAENAVRQLNTTSFQPMRGLLTRQTSGTVTITTAGVYVPINLASNLDADVTFNMAISSAPNVTGLKNTTTQTRTVVFIATYDGKGGNNQAIGLKLALNGVAIDGSECSSFAGSAGQFGKAMTQYMIKLEPNDEVTMLAANLDATTNLNIARLKLLAHAIP